MKKIFSIGLLLAIVNISAFAALPPFAQSKREMLAILNSNELAHFFNSADILQSIKRSQGNSYTVSSSTKEIVVDVIYKGGDERKIGPLDFELVFHPVNLP